MDGWKDIGGQRRIPRHELASLVAEDADWPPFAGYDQFGRTIAVQIAPDSPVHRADALEGPRVRFVAPPASAVTAKQDRRRRLRVTARNAAAADEQVQIA